MAKLVTLSNLERFNEHIELNGGSGYIKTIVTNDTSGNIYVNPSGNSLHYKAKGIWSSVKLYGSKPRAKNLAIRLNDSVRYAGLIDPSESNASAIRVRIGSRIYAVESSSLTMWNGSASVVDGHLEIAPKNYIYCEYPLVIGGEEDIEIYVKKRYPDGSKAISNGTPYFSLVREGKVASSARDTTKPAVVRYDITVSGNATSSTSGMVNLFYKGSNYNKQGNNYVETSSRSSSMAYATRALIVQELDIKEEYDYKWTYTATNKQLKFRCEKQDYSGGPAQYPTAYYDTNVVYIAMGDMLSSNYGTMVVTDFYVKVGGATVMSYASLLSQYS